MNCSEAGWGELASRPQPQGLCPVLGYAKAKEQGSPFSKRYSSVSPEKGTYTHVQKAIHWK